MQYFSSYKIFKILRHWKIISKIYKKIIIKKDPGLIHMVINLRPGTYMHDKREIPSIVNEKIVLKC